MNKSFIIGMLMMVGSMSIFGITGTEIAENVKNRETGKTIHAIMGMELIEKNGDVSPRTIEMWSSKYDEKKDLSKVVMAFLEPAVVKDTRFLQIENSDRDDDKWIYLPALKKVRRIASNEKESSFMGSDFTYGDMESREVEEDIHTLLREEKIGKYDCYVVESIPVETKDEQYSRKIAWIEKNSFVPLKLELYSKNNKEKIKKVMEVKDDIAKINDIWTVFTTEMRDLETGHSTKLYIKKSKTGANYIEYNKPVKNERFTERFLETGRVN